MKGSIYLSLMVVFLCHGGRTPSQSRPGRTAGQRGGHASLLRLRHRRGQPEARPSAPHLRTTSPPVRRAGPRQRTRRGAERQGRLHRQAPRRSRPSGAAPGAAWWRDDQRNGRFGVDGVLGTASGHVPRWAIGAPSSSTSSIVSARHISCRHTACSFRSAGG